MNIKRKILLTAVACFTAVLALLVGFLAFGDNSKDVVWDTDKPIFIEGKRTYQAGSIQVVKGEDRINFEYQPEVNAKSSYLVKAYEYTFISAMEGGTAINLKSIKSDDVIISYYYSDNAIDTESETIVGEEKYTLQEIANKGGKKYIYVLVEAKNEEIPTDFTSNVVWYFGKPATMTYVAGTQTLTQKIVKGQEIDANVTLASAPVGYKFTGWYYDSAKTQAVSFPIATQGEVLYVDMVAV